MKLRLPNIVADRVSVLPMVIVERKKPRMYPTTRGHAEINKNVVLRVKKVFETGVYFYKLHRSC